MGETLESGNESVDEKYFTIVHTVCRVVVDVNIIRDSMSYS